MKQNSGWNNLNFTLPFPSSISEGWGKSPLMIKSAFTTSTKTKENNCYGNKRHLKACHNVPTAEPCKIW